jgi:hypothetical protein
MSDASPRPGFEPEDLDGHTLDELADYLERGRRPRDPSIEESPSCLIALDALQGLRDAAGSILEDDDGDAGAQDWISAVVESIPLDARPGRSFRLPTPHPAIAASVTEGALRGLVRAVGDAVPGLLVGGVRFAPDRPTALDVQVALVEGHRLVPAVARLREELRIALAGHAPFRIDRIDVRVIGLIEQPERRS